jgi:peptide/nickel transport system substrate-binding protein
MKKVLWLALVTVLVIGLVLTSCSGTNSSPIPAQTSAGVPAKSSAAPLPAPSTISTSSPAAGTPKKGGTLKIAESMFPANLGWVGDPTWGVHTSTSSLFLDTLLKVDANNGIHPNIATAGTVAPDLKSITFTLRKGVKFHDGSDWNAAAAKFNFDTLINAKTSEWGKASSAEILDDYTVKVNLSNFTNNILTSMGGTYMVSKAAYDSHGGGKDAETWMRSNPIGTGPFKLAGYQPNVSVKGTRFDGYWQPGKPYLDSVEIYLVSDPMTRAQSLQAKEMDVDAGNISKIEADLKAQGYPVFTNYLSISCLVPDSATSTSPLANLKVRQAIDYAIDRDAIVKSLGFGFTNPLYQFAIPGSSVYFSDLAPRVYSPDKAKQLLTEAGFPTGFKTRILGSTSTTNKDAMTAVQNYLSKIGITIDLNMIDHPTYTDQVRKGWEGFAAASKLVSANMNFAFSVSFMPPAQPSMAKPDDFQSLYKAAASAKDYDPALTRKVVQYMYDNALINCLYADPRVDITQSYVKDPGFFSESGALNWEPQDAWLNK